MIRSFVAVLVLLGAGEAFAKEASCNKTCDELLKATAAECRRAEKHESHGGEHEHDGDACQRVLKQLRTQCLQTCQANTRKKR